MKIAVFPGTFDPFTIGHEEIVLKALPLFDKVVVSIGINSDKKALLSIEQRVNFIKKCFNHEAKIEVIAYQGLTIEFCKQIKANYIIRGIRNSQDFRYEKDIAQMNHTLAPAIETLFFCTSPALSHINSTAVRDIIIHKGDYQQFLPRNLTINEDHP
ncbi:MAG: pantetheine-phosphate adenylyltransferase [Bacteroidales bacterium]|jgi:pantetheine-phosphate adenylyltransferase|nr:pantetheine-phosphate adenylyltransferase [Bacteroidales bacterium]